MSAWLAAPGLVGLGLVVLMWRRLISPTRFAQAASALLMAVAVAWSMTTSWGGSHNG